MYMTDLKTCVLVDSTPAFVLHKYFTHGAVSPPATSTLNPDAAELGLGSLGSDNEFSGTFTEWLDLLSLMGAAFYARKRHCVVFTVVI